MKVIYLLLILFDCVFCYIYVINTDLNVTVVKFEDRNANFGNPFSRREKGYLFESKPLLACDGPIEPPLINFQNSTDIKCFALIKRGNCSFVQKVGNAQAAGYDGVIVFNNINDGIDTMNADVSNDIEIPSRMVSLRSGHILLSQYTFTKRRQNYVLVLNENLNINIQLYIIAFLGFVSLGFFIIGIGFGIKLCRDLIKRRANRLRQCHLKKIPIKKFVKGQDPFETCAICLEDFKDGDKLRILPCNHAYHTMCIDPWLLKQKRNCPICKSRIKIPGRDEDSDSVDDTPSSTLHATANEHTPLIDSRIPQAPRYFSNNETDVQIVPGEQKDTTANCYENLSFGIVESPPGTSSDHKSKFSINENSHDVEDSKKEQVSHLTRIV